MNNTLQNNPFYPFYEDDEGLDTRSLWQIIKEDYGTVDAFIKENRLKDGSRVGVLMRGEIPPSSFPNLTEHICKICSGSVRTLFPFTDEADKYSTIEDSPAFKAIQEKFGIQYYKKGGKSLRALLLREGFSGSECSKFCNCITHTLPIYYAKSLIEKICTRLKIDPSIAFPESEYAWEKDEKMKEKQLPDNAEEALVVEYQSDNEYERPFARDDFRQEVLNALTPKQKRVYLSISNATQPTTLQEVATSLGYARQNIHEYIKSMRKRIRNRYPKVYRAGQEFLGED